MLHYLKQYFNSGSERSIKAKKNIVYSVAIKGVSIAVSILLVPITLGYVNSTQYGIWLTISSILSWMAFFDMGFAQGLRNRCAEAMARNELKLARSYVSTTYLAFVLIFSCVFSLFFIVNRFIDWSYILGIAPELNSEVRVVFDVVAFFFCCQIVLGVINAVLLADQRPAFSSLLGMIGQFLALIIIYVLTKLTTGSLLILALTMSALPVVVLTFCSIWLFSSRYSYLRPNFSYAKYKFVKDIVKLGGKFFIIQISAIFVFQSLNIIISHTQGPDQVTVYNITYKCFHTFNMLFVIFLTPYWSAFTEAYTKKDYSWMLNVYRKLYWLSIGFVLLIMLFLLISDIVYSVWLNDKILIPFEVSLGMAIYISLTTLGCVPVTLLNGTGKIQIQVLLQVFFSIITIPGLLVILNNFNLFWGLLYISLNPLAHFVICTIQFKKVMNNTAAGVWNK